MKLTCHRCGDYSLPKIGIPAEDMRPLGKYGRMHMRYLQEHCSLLFNQLLLSSKHDPTRMSFSHDIRATAKGYEMLATE